MQGGGKVPGGGDGLYGHTVSLTCFFLGIMEMKHSGMSCKIMKNADMNISMQPCALKSKMPWQDIMLKRVA